MPSSLERHAAPIQLKCTLCGSAETMVCHWQLLADHRTWYWISRSILLPEQQTVASSSYMAAICLFRLTSTRYLSSCKLLLCMPAILSWMADRVRVWHVSSSLSRVCEKDYPRCCVRSCVPVFFLDPPSSRAKKYQRSSSSAQEYWHRNQYEFQSQIVKVH